MAKKSVAAFQGSIYMVQGAVLLTIWGVKVSLKMCYFVTNFGGNVDPQIVSETHFSSLLVHKIRDLFAHLSEFLCTGLQKRRKIESHDSIQIYNLCKVIHITYNPRMEIVIPYRLHTIHE